MHFPRPLESSFRKEKGNSIQKVTLEEELVTRRLWSLRGEFNSRVDRGNVQIILTQPLSSGKGSHQKERKNPFLGGLGCTQGWELHPGEAERDDVTDRDALRGGINPHPSQHLKLRHTMAEHAPPGWSRNFEITHPPPLFFFSFWTQFIADAIAVPQVHILQNF